MTLMRDIVVGDLIRLPDGTRGEVTEINNAGFMWVIYLRDDVGRVAIRRVAGSRPVERVETLVAPHPFGPKEEG
jgi:hypothetical protein